MLIKVLFIFNVCLILLNYRMNTFIAGADESTFWFIVLKTGIWKIKLKLLKLLHKQKLHEP